MPCHSRSHAHITPLFTHPDFLKYGQGVDHKGIYKLTYYTAPYFRSLGQQSFYPYIEVMFEITDGNHYHVPITLSPFGYSTYRGN